MVLLGMNYDLSLYMNVEQFWTGEMDNLEAPRLIEELTKQIFSSGFSAVRARAMETATWWHYSGW